MVKAIFLDLDGTVYRGKSPCEDAPESITQFMAKGVEIRYLTNNSATTPNEVTEKLGLMGIPCEPHWVYTSAGVTAKVLARKKVNRVSVVGSNNLKITLESQGIEVGNFVDDEAVVVGICLSFTYELLDQSSQSIRNGAQFYATNMDWTYPLEGQRICPGAGSIVAAVQAASGVNPTVIGKPESYMVNFACEELNVMPHEVIMVGDRVETDIACATRAGVKPWLVLTGVQPTPLEGISFSSTLLGLADYLSNNS